MKGNNTLVYCFKFKFKNIKILICENEILEKNKNVEFDQSVNHIKQLTKKKCLPFHEFCSPWLTSPGMSNKAGQNSQSRDDMTEY